MSDAPVLPRPSLAPTDFAQQMTVLRRRRGLSLRSLARCAGLSHDALGSWERGERLPRLPELGAALTALAVGPAERLRLIALVPAPRAQHHVRTAEKTEWGESAGPLPGLGNLLRAMRGRRGLTQVEAARLAGVSQSRLAHWERSEEWPVAERLHRLCLALGASPEEEAALTSGRGSLPLWDEGEEAEAWACRGAASPDDLLGLRLRQVYFHSGVLRDLTSLSLERALWLRARDSDAARAHLHDAYAWRARALMEEGRFSEVGAYADRTWALARQGYGRSQFWVWGVIASASALRHGFGRRRSRPESAAALLAGAVPSLPLGENQAWLLGELALALAEAGRAEEAVRASVQARAVAERLSDPAEALFRRRDHASLLVKLGRPGEALDALETASDLFRYGADPFVRHHLLAASCHVGLKNAGAAQKCLSPVLILIERQATPALTRLRPQAEALIACL